MFSSQESDLKQASWKLKPRETLFSSQETDLTQAVFEVKVEIERLCVFWRTSQETQDVKE